MIKKMLLLFIATMLLSSCDKKISYSEFEQHVFEEIFLKLVDSTYVDKRLYTLLPNPERGENDPDFLEQREILKKDTIGLVIAVGTERIIPFEKFKSSKFIFKRLSEIPEEDREYERWSEKYLKFAGAMFFSKISFDKKKENGTLNVSYSCGGKCGLGYKVYIKKVQQNWIITKVERTSIS